jgi:hypothetical protein
MTKMMYHILEDLRADGRIPYLEWIFEKYVLKTLIGLSWLRIRSSGGIL